MASAGIACTAGERPTEGTGPTGGKAAPAVLLAPVASAAGRAQDEPRRLGLVVDDHRYVPCQLRAVREGAQDGGLVLERGGSPRGRLLDDVGRPPPASKQ